MNWTPRPLDNPRDGMQDFSRWYRPGTAPRKISPADIDAVLHDGKTRKCLFLEFKPSKHAVVRAQTWMLADLVREGHTCLYVCAEQKDEYYEDDFPIEVGVVHADQSIDWLQETIADLNSRIKRFYE